MIGVVVGEMVDRSDLVPAALSEDVLTVFQFHSYILQHDVQDMETHLLHLAREGEQNGGYTTHLHTVRLILCTFSKTKCQYISGNNFLFLSTTFY